MVLPHFGGQSDDATRLPHSKFNSQSFGLTYPLVHTAEPGAEHLMPAAHDGIPTLEATYDLDWRVPLDDALASNEVARKTLSRMIDVQAAKARSLWVREGREESIRSSIATCLAASGLTMSPQQSAVLDGCRDVAMLERWVTQAARAATVEEALR